jgi:phosphatidylserine/phosphatidylglycerophosphate/cardiolipin synthase-like enzyme
MAAVSGPVAQILGDHARTRWQRATGERLARREPGDSHPWPAGLEPALEDVDVGIVRTNPTESLRETECWHLEALRSARRLVYLENQYLTSRAIGDALDSALARDPGPEIVIVTSRSSSGWLEQNTMDARRAQILHQLRDRDADERCSAWWPDTGSGDSPTVHTKLTLVDDQLAYLGSANLSNRSMGLDTECGLVLDGRDDRRVADVLTKLRRDLLAEHLGLECHEVAAAEDQHDCLRAAIESLATGSRTLRPLEIEEPALGELLEPLASLADPESPAAWPELLPDLGWFSDDE